MSRCRGADLLRLNPLAAAPAACRRQPSSGHSAAGDRYLRGWRGRFPQLDAADALALKARSQGKDDVAAFSADLRPIRKLDHAVGAVLVTATGTAGEEDIDFPRPHPARPLRTAGAVWRAGIGLFLHVTLVAGSWLFG